MTKAASDNLVLSKKQMSMHELKGVSSVLGVWCSKVKWMSLCLCLPAPQLTTSVTAQGWQQSKIEGLLEDKLCRRYDTQSHESAGVCGQGLLKNMVKKMKADHKCGKKDKGRQDIFNTCSFIVSVIWCVCQ